MDIGYLQHGTGNGPFFTESVNVKHEYADKYMAWYEGKWRRIHVQLNRLYIVYMGDKITIKLECL